MGEHVLLVESEAVVRATVARILGRAGFEVHAASSPVEAAAIAAELPSLAVVVADGRLGHGDGPAVLAELRARHPEVRTLMVAGEGVPRGDRPVLARPDETARLIGSGLSGTIARPFEAFALASRIVELTQAMAATRRRDMLLDRCREDVVRMVDSLAEALEARDPYTHGHSLRVADYALLIAADLGLSTRELECLKHGAALHDIGKIAVRQEVLHKEGRLSDEEFEHIKIHPTVGREILEPIADFKAVLDVVYHHHERIDGRGYPENLNGKRIPDFAQIVAVADTYDAMTSDRSYRPGMAPQRAIQVMRDVSGTQLNAEFVERLARRVLVPPQAASA
ncbi:MAG: HD domain-containing phosphohydrolase [Candidatus Sericytochromatia bacterium]|nr:HD domain-containing phosphohydrolase [Candidatus Sericytochromatia bacterium]